MKTKGIGLRFLFIIITFVFVLYSYEAFGSLFSYDWNEERDEDILQGWTPEPIFNGVFDVDDDFGNSGGSIFATDTAGGGVLYARAPVELRGNLSGYTAIEWEEYIPGRTNTVIATFIILQGTDGTRYESKRFQPSEIVTDVWNPRFEPLDDPSAWTRVANTGKATFEEIISDLDTLFISMDTSPQNTRGVESWVDNFTVVPIPGAIWLLGSGLVGLVVIRRKFRNDRR